MKCNNDCIWQQIYTSPQIWFWEDIWPQQVLNITQSSGLWPLSSQKSPGQAGIYHRRAGLGWNHLRSKSFETEVSRQKSWRRSKKRKQLQKRSIDAEAARLWKCLDWALLYTAQLSQVKQSDMLLLIRVPTRESWLSSLFAYFLDSWSETLWFSVFLAWSALPDAAAAYEWRSERLASANCGKVASEPARFLETASFMLFRQLGMNILHIQLVAARRILSRLSSVFGNTPWRIILVLPSLTLILSFSTPNCCMPIHTLQWLYGVMLNGFKARWKLPPGCVSKRHLDWFGMFGGSAVWKLLVSMINECSVGTSWICKEDLPCD